MNALIPRMSRRSLRVPMVELHSAGRLFDDLFRGFAAAPGWTPATFRADFVPHVDIRESDEEIVFTAEIPGVDHEDFEVALEEDVLILKGEKRSESETDEKGYRRMEIRSGRFERRFALPFEVDGDAVKAAYKNGVLTVTVPKPGEAEPEVRQIEVTSA